jgi:hypothetical protein
MRQLLVALALASTGCAALAASVPVKIACTACSILSATVCQFVGTPQTEASPKPTCYQVPAVRCPSGQTLYIVNYDQVLKRGAAPELKCK